MVPRVELLDWEKSVSITAKVTMFLSLRDNAIVTKQIVLTMKHTDMPPKALNIKDESASATLFRPQ